MKKTIAIVILILILLIPLWSWLAWYFSPAESLNVLVINKSSDPGEHQSFNWVLSQNKYFSQLFKEYNYKEDYLSDSSANLPPGDMGNKDFNRHLLLSSVFSNMDENLLDSLADFLEIAYLAEAYPADVAGYRESSDKSGETGEAEYNLLKKLFEKRKLIIAEAHTLGMTEAPPDRNNMESLFAMDYTGWKFKFFPSLETGANSLIPEWVIEAYENQHNVEFDFEAESGIIFIHRNGNIVVLEDELHLELKVPVISTSASFQHKYSLPAFTEYTGWVEINLARNEEDVISSFNIHTNPTGDSLLVKYNIPKKFPAIIGDNEESLRFYFCGDFADNPVQDELAHFKGVHWISGMFHGDDPDDARKFFWEYYYPLIESIIENYKNKSFTATQNRELPMDVTPVNNDSLYSREPADKSINELTNGQSKEEDTSMGVSENKIKAIPDNFKMGQSEGQPGKWYIIIGSRQTEDKAERFVKRKGYSSLEIIYMPELNTYRVSYGSYDKLLEAQKAFAQILEKEPNAWIVQL